MAEPRQDFDCYWRDEVCPLIRALIAERQRQGVWASYALLAGTGAFAAVLCVTVFNIFGIFEVDDGIRIIWGICASAYLALVAYRAVGKHWNKSFTNAHGRIARAICAYHGLEYYATLMRLPTGEFQDLGLIPDHGEVAFKHTVTGKLDGAAFRLSEAALKKDAVYRLKRLDSSRDDVALRAVMARARYRGGERAFLIAASDSGFVMNRVKNLFTKGERVRLEDPAFERAFEVFAHDQIGARVLLPPRVVETLQDLKERHDLKELRFAIADGWIWIVAEVREGEVSLGDALRGNEEGAAERFASILNGFVEFVRILNETAPREPAPPGAMPDGAISESMSPGAKAALR